MVHPQNTILFTLLKNNIQHFNSISYCNIVIHVSHLLGTSAHSKQSPPNSVIDPKCPGISMLVRVSVRVSG